MRAAVLLFDIDGTLIDAAGAGQHAMDAALREDFGAIRPVDGIPTAGRTDHAITSELFRFHALNDHADERERLKQCYLSRLPGSLAAARGTVLPGVASLLEQLAKVSAVERMLLTGNYEQAAWLKLEHFGLDHYFETGAFGDHHSDRDDVARLIDDVLKERTGGVDYDRVFVIGDTPADIRCARAIGAKAIAVATGVYTLDELKPANADYLVQDLTDPAWLWEILA